MTYYASNLKFLELLKKWRVKKRYITVYRCVTRIYICTLPKAMMMIKLKEQFRNSYGQKSRPTLRGKGRVESFNYWHPISLTNIKQFFYIPILKLLSFQSHWLLLPKYYDQRPCCLFFFCSAESINVTIWHSRKLMLTIIFFLRIRRLKPL